MLVALCLNIHTFGTLGPEGTPYANGCFYFDLHLSDYPNRAPEVKFLSTGHGRIRFNPNLYNCGKVCLSLLGTWTGPGWIPGQSTILQVLVSIQGLILGVADPYFNEPGYESGRGARHHQTASDKYSANIRRYTLQYCIAEPLAQTVQTIQSCDQATIGGAAAADNYHKYPEFAIVVMRHYAVRAGAIATQLQEWTTLDASLSTVADQIRAHLPIVVAAYHRTTTEQQLQQCRLKRKQPPYRSSSGAQPELVILDD